MPSRTAWTTRRSCASGQTPVPRSSLRQMTREETPPAVMEPVAGVPRAYPHPRAWSFAVSRGGGAP